MNEEFRQPKDVNPNPFTERADRMNNASLSPLATASRDLVMKLARGAETADVEAGCRDLLTNNTNGLGSFDTRMVDVASEIVRGVLAGVAMLRSPGISAATRGMSDTGPCGPSGDADRLSISERACREVRDSPDASGSDFASALEGAAPAARMTAGELRDYVNRTPPRPAKGTTG